MDESWLSNNIEFANTVSDIGYANCEYESVLHCMVKDTSELS